MEQKIKIRVAKLKSAIEMNQEGILNLTQVQRVKILREVTILEDLLK